MPQPFAMYIVKFQFIELFVIAQFFKEVSF